jgi:iron complex transport system substrate-binding protein
VIVTQSQCEVCAVSERDVEEAVCDWLEDRPRIISLAPSALADVWADIERVAAALGAPEQGATLVAALQQRIEAIAAEGRLLRERPRVACIEWLDPLMAAGNWMPELVEMAGGVNLFGETGKHSPWMDWDDLVAADPDAILVLPCGFDIERTRRDLGLLTRRPGWNHLRAVRSGRVYLTDGNQYFNRPGPRLVESLEILAEVLHPDRFHFGHQGHGWQPL